MLLWVVEGAVEMGGVFTLLLISSSLELLIFPDGPASSGWNGLLRLHLLLSFSGG